jgi:hypothetical protein
MPVENRHYQDELYLSLQKAESSYNVPLLQWDSTTCTLLSDLDDASVHELWDDTVIGTDLIRVGARYPARQARAAHSMRVPVTQPRVTPHALAGLVGLTLGTVTTTQQPFLASYRHRLTLADPTALPSISAQIGHLQNVYALYGGLKGDTFTLRNNGPYLSLTTHLIGAGSRQDVTGTVQRGSTLVTTGTPPEAWQLTDVDAGIWYVYPDGAGSFVIDIAAPPGTVLDVGLGLALLAVNGTRYQVGIATNGTLEISVVSTEGPHVLDIAALRDSGGQPWYVWLDAGTLVQDTVRPPTPVARITEPWLRWGNGRLWLADVTDTPYAVPATLTQGVANITPSAIDISSRVLSLTITGENHLLASQAYRVSSGNVRSNFHASQQALSITLELEVTLAQEAADLTQYLDQRIMAFEWQCLEPGAIAPITVTLLTSGTPPDWHAVQDSTAVTWYLSVDQLGEPTVTSTLPTGTGPAVGLGLEMLALDGWRYRLGVDVLGGYTMTQTTFVGTTPHLLEVLAFRDTRGVTWYVWPDGLGGIVVDTTAPAFAPWRRGFAWVCPRLQWRAIVRTTQAQQDVLELTGTVEEDPAHEPVVVDIWNAQPGYLQAAA